jgi:hypothetical protein
VIRGIGHGHRDAGAKSAKSHAAMIVSDPDRLIAAAAIAAAYLAFCVLVFWRHRRKRRSPPYPERAASPVRRGPIVEARGKIAAITLADQLPVRGRLGKRRR